MPDRDEPDPAEGPAQSEMVQLAMAGDSNALAELFERYRGRLHRMVQLRMDARVRARFAASDVVQEVFLDVARRLPNYQQDPRIPFFLWMRMLTGDRLAQLHRMHLGAEMRDVRREAASHHDRLPDASSVYLASQLAGQFTSVDRGLKREEIQLRLEAALSSMATDDREIIAMRNYEELSTDEIATALNITRSGVLKRYTRAIRKLSAAIGSTTNFSAQ